MEHLHTIHAVPSRPRHGPTPPAARRPRGLALRERAVLRLAARQGGVSITVRCEGRIVAGAYDRLNLLAELNERGLLRYAGLRTRGRLVDIVYEA